MDITNPRVLKLKGLLFLALGILGATLLILSSPTLRTASLLAITVWAFCRFYYFAFYVLQHYADPEFRYAGLLHLVRYLLSGRKQR